MHLERAHIRSFKRFHDLTIEIPATPRLVVMCGPNGIGKSSVFDAFRFWHGAHGRGEGYSFSDDYHQRAGDKPVQVHQAVELAFHEDVPEGEAAKKLIYARSAYRHQADFTIQRLERSGSLLDERVATRMIDSESKVSNNYQRLISTTIDQFYSGDADQQRVGELREAKIGQIRDAMLTLFPDLRLTGPGDPMGGGTFFFRKETEGDFHYKNLSGGEKAAFDLVLDLALKARAYDRTIFCLDEPELHLNTRVQSRLLDVLLNLIPEDCQLWIATHSIGMMRRADQIYREDPSAVAFLDFEPGEFDQPASIHPVAPSRELWGRVLDIALDDLADLMAPEVVVMCEGRPAGGVNPARAEFDARCYRAIFKDEYPRVDFLSVGNSDDVANDKLEVGRVIQTLVAGTRVIRVIDRDMRTAQELEDLQAAGIRVLSRRHIEAYLMSDEVLAALATERDDADRADDLMAARNECLERSVARGNDEDDYKSAAGDFYTEARRILKLTNAGATKEAFLADSLAPLLSRGMVSFDALEEDIFGPLAT